MASSKIPIKIGARFGRWTVIGETVITKTGQYCHPCRCDCGTERLVRSSDLRRGLSKSCGCLSIDQKIAGKGTEAMMAKMAMVRAAKTGEWKPKRKKKPSLKPYIPNNIEQFGLDEWMLKKL